MKGINHTKCAHHLRDCAAKLDIVRDILELNYDHQDVVREQCDAVLFHLSNFRELMKARHSAEQGAGISEEVEVDPYIRHRGETALEEDVIEAVSGVKQVRSGKPKDTGREAQMPYHVTTDEYPNSDTTEKTFKTKQELRESLADYAHRSWSGWMTYLFSKSATNPDGSVTIPKEQVERWRRQIATPYSGLSKREQESELREADAILRLKVGS